MLEALGSRIMAVAERAPSQRQCVAEQTLRLVVAVLLRQRVTQEIHRRRDARIPIAEETLALRQRALEQRRRLREEPQARVDPAEDAAQLRLHLGLSHQRRVDAFRTAIEQVASADRAAIDLGPRERIGNLEHLDEETLYLRRLACLQLGAIAKDPLT